MVEEELVTISRDVERVTMLYTPFNDGKRFVNSIRLN